jgi:hypothetical protein
MWPDPVNAIKRLHISDVRPVCSLVVAPAAVPDTETPCLWVSKNSEVGLKTTILLARDQRIGEIWISLRLVDLPGDVLAFFD